MAKRSIDFGVTVTGLADTRAALGQIDKQALRAMDKGIRGPVQTIASGARAITPRRTGESKRGVRVRRIKARRNSAGWSIVQVARGASIGEFAAKGHTPQGRSLVVRLNTRYGARTGRFLWKAYDERKGSVTPAITKAVNEGMAVVQKDLNMKAGR